MKKKYRLLKSKDFKEVLNQNNKYFSKQLMCHYLYDSTLKNIKIGVIIPKKKCKKAVDRNYLKRIFWYLHQFQDLEKLPKFKCIFVYNKQLFQDFFNQGIFIKKINNDIKWIYSLLKNTKHEYK